VSSAPTLHTMINRIGETQLPLPAAASIMVGIAVLAAVGVQEIWLVAQHVYTIAHEGAHAIAGSAVGQRILSVRLQPNAEGNTLRSGGKVPGNVTASVAGYLGPSAFGLGAAKLIELRHSVAVLWLTLLLLLCLLVVLRGIFSFVAVIITGGLIYLIARYASVGVDTVTAYGVAWFLLLSGVRVVVDHGVNAGDARNLASMTRIRPRFWVLVWLSGTIAALLFGGSLLV
jgi:Peptidase M50B-like